MTGGGQAYNEQYAKGAVFFGGAVIGMAMFFSNDGLECTGDCTTNNVGLGIWVAAQSDLRLTRPSRRLESTRRQRRCRRVAQK
jgi:hypothetical protein